MDISTEPWLFPERKIEVSGANFMLYCTFWPLEKFNQVHQPATKLMTLKSFPFRE
jgi:hypothetical protein